MEKFVINGGNALCGTVDISGAKNAAVAIIPATILIEDECIIENVPDIQDVRIILDILSSLGAKVEKISANTVKIDASTLNTYIAEKEMASKMRASYYLLGALCGRFKKAAVPPPGGCNFGIRPIDQHIKGFEALNCKVEIKHGSINVDGENIKGGQVYFDVVSVGATINLMLAAVRAPGVTVMENAAKEPHIVDVANFLNSMGANIKSAGTDVIKITGVEKLHGGTYGVIPDQIEAGTYMFAAAATRGDVTIRNVIPKHLEAITSKFIEMGVDVTEGDDEIRVCAKGNLNKINVKTLPYPGFPTDLQPPMVALLTTVNGTSIVTESVWDSRFQYVAELEKMGAKITVNGSVAVIEGGHALTGADVKSTDLRAGAGMVIAALCANGTTEILNVYHIDRGYENIIEKLTSLGADIKRTDD
ncbi:UDP-N-acetylglucosamine 1-carboxyvinyltransferase [Qingrenia yutianensis]|uniref:UDP-N-acetylglucosamine 1-carboxyvinyltransferase n=1 Tax=Qingrenia yutianensis TaxID=2763676 RepID=A0A926F783_9FIRM|nr:UDP-N-acetylglucosamine 1-carboxyvinyltransferase [Qingrenia yutianensis]MBC8597093.1 UDP-N-acetylglucosamine 1-carboxyvinyltransferase [Qingrenia yutianensis]